MTPAFSVAWRPTRSGWTRAVPTTGQPACDHFEPGWRWSVNVKPIMQTELCEASHFGYVEQGVMRIHLKDGSEQDLAPRQIVAIPPGHDAEVLGDETCIFIDFGEIGEYAKRKA